MLKYGGDSEMDMDRLLTGNWLGARCAALGKQLTETVGAVRLVVATGEPLSGQRRRTVGAGEALAMPRLAFIRDAARRDDLSPLNTIKPIAFKLPRSSPSNGSGNPTAETLTSLHLMQRVAYFSS